MRSPRILRIAGALALILVLAPTASAQCAMCANAAAAQQAEARKALNLGIAALVAPVFLLIGGFVFLSYKRRNPPESPSGNWPDLHPLGAPRTTIVNLPLDSSSDDSPPPAHPN